MLEIARHFCLQGFPVQCLPFGKGHINSTFLVTTDCGKKYILQRINNVLLDTESHRSLYVLDLDTVMPGLSLYDYGDAIRFSARIGAEDEKDASGIHLALALFRAYTHL